MRLRAICQSYIAKPDLKSRRSIDSNSNLRTSAKGETHFTPTHPSEELNVVCESLVLSSPFRTYLFSRSCFVASFLTQ